MLRAGERYYDPHADKEFTVQEDLKTAGRSTFELDQEQVHIEFDSGDEYWVPYDRFSGVNSYEFVEAAS